MENLEHDQIKKAETFSTSSAEQPKLQRIDKHYLLHEIEHLIHFERGFLYTVREVLIRPSETIKTFLHTDRTKLTKPIIFVILTSLFYTLLNSFFHIEQDYATQTHNIMPAITGMLTWIQNHYGYSNLIMLCFITPLVKLFFRKTPYNFWEIVVMLCYVNGISMLFATFFGIVELALNIKVLMVGIVLAVVYTVWAIGQFFNKNDALTYIKAFFAYSIGYLIFMIVMMVLAVGYAMIMR